MTETATTATTGRRWTRILPGIALVAVVLVVVVEARSALVANNVVYPLTLLLALVLGIWLLMTGVRGLAPARRGGVRTTLRVLAAAGGIGLAAMLLWLKPWVATEVALDAFASSGTVTVTDSRSETVYAPVAEARAGLVIYGGARVDPRAYAVLASQVASGGYRVVVVKCPYDLELLCPNAAAGYVDATMPWAVGGHSLGGVAASSFAGAHPEVAGLVLWASYPVSDLSTRTGLATVSITGTEDGLATPAKVDERKPLMPPDTVFTPIVGGIHSFFGDYGLQPGDGTPTISREDAQSQIIAATVGVLDRLARS